MTLPPAADLIALVREQGPSALDAYAPEVDRLAGVTEVAEYLGIQPATVYRERARGRWAEPEPLPGRSPLWKYRAVIAHRAGRPGPGNWGPRKDKPASSVPVP